MLFTEATFIGLVAGTFLLYYTVANLRWQTIILLVASLLFYTINHPILLALLISVLAINTLATRVVENSSDKNKKRLWATAAVVLNLLILIFFKYSPLLGHTFLDTSQGLGQILVIVPLPIGISFYTFQGISLVIDTYRGKTTGTNNYKKVPLYLSFFPQLVAGPIVKARDFLPQIETKYFKNIPWELAVTQLITGYFLKMVIADNLSSYTAFMGYPFLTNVSSVNLLALVFAYSLRIFADFAGYSLIAMGIASLFGYRLPINFNFPYISKSFSEFWTRWHITLSSFLKEYLYFSLGGNQKSKARTFLNLMITMTLGGIWHGATWTFALWGIYHGLLLCMERLLNFKNSTTVFSIIYVFTLVSFGWLFFVFDDVSDIGKYLSGVYTQWDKPMVLSHLFYIVLYSLPIIAYYLIGLHKIRPSKNTTTLIYALMLFFILWNSGPSSPFVYFRF